jgi:hypothetical protein
MVSNIRRLVSQEVMATGAYTMYLS